MSSDGCNEIVLTGIHIGYYGLDLLPECSLLDIVNMLVESFPHIRFRLISIKRSSHLSSCIYQITDKIKRDRVNILIDISNKKRLAYLNSKLGEYLNVIVESNSSTNGLYKGISDNYIRLMIRAGNLSKGQRLRVRVISLTNSVLITKPIN